MISSFLFTTASFIVALGILITVHEFGHFWVARKLGVKVLRFSIGFGKPLLKYIGKTDGTEFVVAAIPLGGYVKMLDERVDEVAAAEVHRAFNRQTVLVRSAIVVAGPLFNFIFAFFAYWAIFISGESGLRPLVGTVEPASVAAEAGFKVDDELLFVSGRATPTWEKALDAFLAESLRDGALRVLVKDADGYEEVYQLPQGVLSELSGEKDIFTLLGISPKRPVLPAVIGEVLGGEAADRAGLKAGDRVLSVDGKRLDSWGEWVAYIQKRPDQKLVLEVERAGSVLDISIVTSSRQQGDKEIGRIGASVDMPEGLYDDYTRVVHYGPLEAAKESAEKIVDLSWLMVKMMGRMLTGQASVENLSGPISIAKAAGNSASYGPIYFLKFLAIISISLAVLNLFPIPILDGGHLFFFLIEAIKGSPVSEQVMLQGQKVGIVLLLSLMVIAFYVDIGRLLR
ncbi:MAG: RIP metalloprotease RseP [Candidatus Polarisedimenticolaceae bacterium]|nr:RIP metalloprotease RseP [Candidatus Polarisedimenticolaceae bacterium]